MEEKLETGSKTCMEIIRIPRDPVVAISCKFQKSHRNSYSLSLRSLNSLTKKPNIYRYLGRYHAKSSVYIWLLLCRTAYLSTQPSNQQPNAQQVHILISFLTLPKTHDSKTQDLNEIFYQRLPVQNSDGKYSKGPT